LFLFYTIYIYTYDSATHIQPDTLPKHLVQLVTYHSGIPLILYPKRNRWILFFPAMISIDPHAPLEGHIIIPASGACTGWVMVHIPQIVQQSKVA